MKAFLLLLAAGAGLIAGPLRAAESGTVEVIYSHPEDFTDVKDRANPTSEGRTGLLDQLRRYLVTEAGRPVPAGDKLTLTFIDIDLAGDFEPWRGPQVDGVRIVKPIYPPAFKFAYTVTDASGIILQQGEESIRDVAFQERAAPDTDPLRYEKAVLGEWIRRHFKGLR